MTVAAKGGVVAAERRAADAREDAFRADRYVGLQIERLNGRIEEQAREHPGACLLQTIPGIRPYRSLQLVGEIEPISRFPSPDRLVSSAGFAPRTRSPGGKARYGSTPKAANRWARGALAGHVLRTTEGADRVAEGLRGHRPNTLPGHPRHALHGGRVARVSRAAIRRIGVSSSHFMQLRLPSFPLTEPPRLHPSS